MTQQTTQEQIIILQETIKYMEKFKEFEQFLDVYYAELRLLKGGLENERE